MYTKTRISIHIWYTNPKSLYTYNVYERVITCCMADASTFNTYSNNELELNCVQCVCRGKVNIKLNDETAENISASKKQSYFNKSKKDRLSKIVQKGRKAVARVARFVTRYSHLKSTSIVNPSSLCMVICQ